MKTLRLLRNIAVLFMLVMALLASRPRVLRASNPNKTAGSGKACGFANKPGHNCYIDASGNCKESPCNRSTFGCLNSGCV